MNPDRDKIVYDLFQQAREIPHGGREAWLAGLGVAADIVADVRGLLLSGEVATYLQDAGAEEPMMGKASKASAYGYVEGNRIGQYQIVSVLGHGSYGVVYLADQLEPVQRSVSRQRSSAQRAQRSIHAR